MKRNKIFTSVTAILLVGGMTLGLTGCAGTTSATTAANTTNATNATSATETTGTTSEAKNTDTINVVWYPNESSNTHAEVRDEVGKIIEQATGRKVEHKLTTDYTIAIEAIASGSADIAMGMGAVGYIEAKNKNPEIDVMFVNADKNGKIDEAKYFAWLCVNKADAEQYKSGDTYSIENIKGKKMSYVSNSSTSGFKVPSADIMEYFNDDNLDADKLIEGGKDQFFSEVYFGGSHQGSTINLVNGIADVAAFCDIELASYIELKEGSENTVGAVYGIKSDADAPFNAHTGKEFTVIACTPVFNGPCAYNPGNLSPDEVKALQDVFTSKEVADNPILFYDGEVEGATGYFKKSSSYGYVLTTDSWYDAYRK